ncbi:MAG: hypothetical protein RIT43_368 [Bacteroidota bacterium]|jgi:hypothetical protein
MCCLCVPHFQIEDSNFVNVSHGAHGEKDENEVGCQCKQQPVPPKDDRQSRREDKYIHNTEPEIQMDKNCLYAPVSSSVIRGQFVAVESNQPLFNFAPMIGFDGVILPGIQTAEKTTRII